MPSLLIGSNNEHKVRELRQIASMHYGDRLTILQPGDFTTFPTEIEETGTTLEQNAYIKAEAIFAATGIACFADDTGLEAAALNGRPGVYSARYAGKDATFSDNRKKLLTELNNTVGDERRARFRTVICYRDALRTLFAEGICNGGIAAEERGEHGFGYDSIFIPQGYKVTFAELAPEVKNRISHRALALEHFFTTIDPYLRDGQHSDN